jgi:hypothetical protein
VDSGKSAKTATNEYEIQGGNQQEPEIIQKGKAMKSRLPEKIQEPPKKKAKFSINVPALSQSSSSMVYFVQDDE